MHSVVRVAAYAPTASASGRRVAAADEDAFTMGATVVERALGLGEPPSGQFVVHLLGDFPPMADWGFSSVIGREARVLRHPATAGELTRTLRSTEEMEGGPALIVVAEMPERSSEEGPTPSSLGAGAVAYFLKTSDRSAPFPLERSGTNDSALTLAIQRGSVALGRAYSQVFVGDWDVAPQVGRSIDPTLIGTVAEEGLSVVSEGAYVPRARYLENLPSRWRFVAQECDVCHEVTFPARGVCRRCRRGDTLTSVLLPRDGGRVVAITRIGKGGQPTEFDGLVEHSGPYEVALVELTDATRVTLMVTDSTPGEVAVGDPVNSLLRRLYPMEGEWRYGRKAVPALP